MKRKIAIWLAGALIGLTACQPDPLADMGRATQEGEALARAMEFGALPFEAPAPSDNPTTADKVRLGELLFFDPIISGEKDVSCATCHHPGFGFSDGRDLPIGVGGRGLGPDRVDAVADDIGLVPRNSPSVINTAFNGMQPGGSVDPANAPMFWDNRAVSLENQAQGPPTSFIEMRGHAFAAEVALDSVVARLQNIREYRELFRRAFPRSPGINILQVSQAIAAYERTIIAPNAPFDQFVRGDEQALNEQQKAGLLAFANAGCGACHSGPMFSDWQLHTLGVPEHPQLDSPDRGINGDFAFRTPTLRNLSVTGPYFHNGTSGTLRDVVQFYLGAQRAARDGNPGQFNPNVTQLDPLLAEQRLRREDVEEVVAFLESLNDPNFNQSVPNRVPSGLPVGGL